MVSQTTQWVNLGIAGFLLVVASIITGMTVKYSPSISTTTSCDIRPQPGDTSTVDNFIKTNWTGPEITGTTGKCLDIRDYLFPKVVFKPTNDPKCAVHFTVKAGSSPNGMMISSWSIAPDEVQYCDTGTFYLYTSLTSSTAVATLTITQATASTAASTFTIDTSSAKRKDINFISRPEKAYTVTLEFTASTNKDTSIGTWTNNGLEQQISTTPSVTAKQCVQYRHNLADGLDAETGCTSQQSQFCTCVASFTSHVREDRTVLQQGLDSLRDGIVQCSKNTRQMDKAAACTEVKTIYVFLAFTILVLLGAILEVVKPRLALYDMGVGGAVWFAVFAVAVIFMFIANMSIGGVTVVSLVVVALAGFYWAYIVHAVGIQTNKIGLYTLIGYFFAGVFLLMLFTLLTRGVTDLDVLLVATGKCIALTVLYGALVAYYTTGNITNKPTNSAYGPVGEPPASMDIHTEYNIAPLHDSKRLLILLIILLSSDHLFIPYATPSSFEVHWLLPTLFTWAMLAPMLHSGFEDHFKIDNTTNPDKPNTTKTGSLIQAAIPTIILFYLCVYHLQAYMFDVRPFTPVEQQIFFSS